MLYFLPLGFMKSNLVDLEFLGHAVERKEAVIGLAYEVSHSEFTEKFSKNIYMENLEFSEQNNKELVSFWNCETVFRLIFCVIQRSLIHIKLLIIFWIVPKNGMCYRFQLEKYMKCKDIKCIKLFMKDIIKICAEMKFIKRNINEAEMMTKQSYLMRLRKFGVFKVNQNKLSFLFL